MNINYFCHANVANTKNLNTSLKTLKHLLKQELNLEELLLVYVKD